MQPLPRGTRRAARLLRIVCLFGLIGLGALALAIPFALGGFIEYLAHDAGRPVPDWGIGAAGHALLLGSAYAALAAAAYTLWQMAGLFACIARGSALSSPAVRAMRGVGQGFVAQAVVAVLATPLQGLGLSQNAPPGQGMVAIGISSQHLAFLLAGAMMLLIGHVLVQAVEAAQENERFV